MSARFDTANTRLYMRPPLIPGDGSCVAEDGVLHAFDGVMCTRCGEVIGPWQYADTLAPTDQEASDK